MSTDAPDYPPVTCSQCKDLTFARKIAAQIRDGQGDRINSNLKFRHLRDEDRIAYAEYALDPKAYCETHGTLPRAWSVNSISNALERTGAPSGVLGRFGERAVQARWQDCDVGDCVGERHWTDAAMVAAQGLQHLIMCVPILYQWAPTACGEVPDPTIRTDIERRTFERVSVQLTDDGGYHWNTHFFWKRTS